MQKTPTALLKKIQDLNARARLLLHDLRSADVSVHELNEQSHTAERNLQRATADYELTARVIAKKFAQATYQSFHE